MTGDDRTARARQLFLQAYRHQRSGRLDEAILLYRQSLDLVPTPLAHTYLGSAYGAQGLLDEALAECRRAIELDPDVGLPYHDIAIYLSLQGYLDDSLEWLEKAKRAPRSPRSFRHLPYLSQGRVLMALGQRSRALEEFRAALELDPGNPVAASAIRELLGQAN